MSSETSAWKALIVEKCARQQATIPKEWLLKNPPSDDVLDVTNIPETCGLLSPKEIEITNTYVDVLLPKLAKGTWTAVEVTTAFAKRAVIAHQLTNCLTELFIDRALVKAAELDAYRKKTGRPSVLFMVCLPISLKDQINIEGLESTMGYVSWIGKFAEKSSVLADILQSAGAILYVKTNIPQTLMWPETFNHIFGRTYNPHNRSLTSGGSSGGEGALVAMKGSPLGVGSDIGGSIRIPAGFCGTYGLRPSYHRVPYAGCVNSMEGQDSVPSVLGPLSTSISGIKAFMQAVISQQPWLKDPLAIRKAWDESAYKLGEHGKGTGRLCFGFVWDDEVIKPHPPVLRGLREVKAALVAAGHNVIDWEPLKHGEIFPQASKIWAAAAAEDYATTIAATGEPLIESMSLLASDPDAKVERPAFRPPLDSKGLSSYQLWQIQKRRKELREEYAAYWNASVERTGTGRPVDALITPVAPYVAPPHGLNKTASYTMVWNVLDYPALIMPVSKVDLELDKPVPPHAFYGKADKENYESYNPTAYKNAPICIQLVGRTLEEEAVIGMGEVIDEVLKKSKNGKARL
ncbi:amidase signature domain-containing protein [Cyathus striatus]|nr:amidase signature domain-containing protein [Cyathus striatus]